MSESIGGLPTKRLATLWGILTLALILRLTGLDWGLPRSPPEETAAGSGASYARGETELLEAPDRLTLAGLEAAQAAGWFTTPWRDAFREMRPGDFERVYAAGRSASVAADLLTVFLSFLIGWRMFGAEAGLWAAALAAASPGHVLASGRIGPDAPAAALVAATVFLAAARTHPALVGATAAAAACMKAAAGLPAAAVLVWFAWPRRKDRRFLALLAAGAAVGGWLGLPSAGEWSHWEWGGFGAPLESLSALARFSLGAPAFGLAAVGLWGMWRRGESPVPAMFVAGLAASFARSPLMLADLLPLVPLAAIAASGVIVCSGRTRLLGAAAVGWAIAISATVVAARLAPHPVNLAASVLRQAAEPGSRVSRAAPGIPPLDPARYPEGPSPTDGPLDASGLPEWAVTSSAAPGELPPENRGLLDERYRAVAVFRGRADAGWLTFGRARAPVDWEETSPRVALYRLR